MSVTDAEVLAYFPHLALFVETWRTPPGKVRVRAGCAHQTDERFPINYTADGNTLEGAVHNVLEVVRVAVAEDDANHPRWRYPEL